MIIVSKVLPDEQDHPGQHILLFSGAHIQKSLFPEKEIRIPLTGKIMNINMLTLTVLPAGLLPSACIL